MAIGFLNKLKSKDPSTNPPFEKVSLDDKEEILKSELSHFPSHVLSRALLISAKLLAYLDLKNEFSQISCDDLDFIKNCCPDEYIMNLVTKINKMYEKDKGLIDKNLKRGIH